MIMFFNRGKKQFLANLHRANRFYHHFKRGTRLVLAMCVVIALLTSIYLIQGLFHKQQIKADVAKFYPGKCLGGWQYPAHAENVPDLDALASIDDFNDVNSAVLDNAMAQLYCSTFNGESPIGTVPKTLTLRLSLAVKPKISLVAPVDSSSSTPAVEIDPIATTTPDATSTEPVTSGDAPATNIDPTTPTEPAPVEVPVSAPAIESPAPAEPAPAPVEPAAPVDQPEPTSLLPRSLVTNFWSWLFIHQAQAQESEVINQTEEKVETPPVIDNPAPTNPTNPDGQSVLGEQVTSAENMPTTDLITDTGISSSSSTTTATTTEEWLPVPTSTLPMDATSSVELVMPADALLQVSYTLDGQTWKTLGWVAESNWREVKFVLPLDGISDWSGLDWLQIRFDRVMTLNSNEPIFYLDGLWLEAEYDALEEKQSMTDEDQPDLKKDKILKQKIGKDYVAINVIRNDTKRQEIWFTLSKSASTTAPVMIPGIWNKIEVEGEEGRLELLDVRGNRIFWLARRPDKKMLYNYVIDDGNINSSDVVPNDLSVVQFDEVIGTSTEAQTTNLYFKDEDNSYYFSQ